MRSRDAGILVRRATSTTTGSIRAATPMLFMNADSTAPVIMMTTIIANSCRAGNPHHLAPDDIRDARSGQALRSG